MAEILPLPYVRNMYFDRRDLDRGDGVSQRKARVGVRGGVDDQALRSRRFLLQPVDESSFGIRLESTYFRAGSVCAVRNHPLDVRKGGRAVDFGLARAEGIQIRAVGQQNAHIGGIVAERGAIRAEAGE